MKLSNLLTELKSKKRENLILFAGAGISIGSGLYNWDAFLTSYVEFCEKMANTFDYRKKDDPRYKEDDIIEFKKNIELAKKSEDKLKGISLLNLTLEAFSFVDSLQTQLFSDVFQIFISKKPNDLHRKIIECNFPCILTSNYDDLLEKASVELGITEYDAFSLDYSQEQQIATCMYNKKKFILHVHGSARFFVKNSNLIVTKKDYLEIMKKHQVFRYLLKCILLDKDILFVGYGQNDPHIQDLLEEMDLFFPEKSKADNFGKNHLPSFYFLTDEVSDINLAFAKHSRVKYVKIDYKTDFNILFDELKKLH